jgi:predicted transcriptional regulator
MISLTLYPHEFLIVARRRLEMTQGELAKLLGTSRQMVNYYEAGVVGISNDKMEKIKEMVRETAL